MRRSLHHEGIRADVVAFRVGEFILAHGRTLLRVVRLFGADGGDDLVEMADDDVRCDKYDDEKCHGTGNDSG